MTIEIENPIQIDRIKLGQTLEGNQPRIEMYSGALKHAILKLPEFRFGDMFDVGIDPNTLDGQTRHVRFLAHWEFGDKFNDKGNRYRNITRLEPIAIQNHAEAAMLRELQTIRELITYLAEQQPGGREAVVEWYKARRAQ